VSSPFREKQPYSNFSRSLFGSIESGVKVSDSTPLVGPATSQYHDTRAVREPFFLFSESSGSCDRDDRTVADILALTSPAVPEQSASTAVTRTQVSVTSQNLELSSSSTDSRLYISEVAGYLASDLISTWFSMVKTVNFDFISLSNSEYAGRINI
jgi:hypothetical protein